MDYGDLLNDLGLDTKEPDPGIRVTVIGVGNGGLKVIDTLVERQLKGVTLIAADTDIQALSGAKATNRLLLGPKLTKGKSSGGDFEKGKKAAIEVRDRISELFDNADLVVVVTMLGNGTGSGATPEILRSAKDKGLLTLCVAVVPYGNGNEDIAQRAIQEIEENSNAYMLLFDENLAKLEIPTLVDTYIYRNNIMADSVQSIIDIVGRKSDANLQIEHIKNVLSKGGRCLISTGSADGDDRASTAIHNAINNPLTEVSLEGVDKLLVYAEKPRNLKVTEETVMFNTIREQTKRETRIISGFHIKEDAEDNTLKIHMIAAGITPMEKQQELENMDNEVEEVEVEDIQDAEPINGPTIVRDPASEIPYAARTRGYNVYDPIPIQTDYSTTGRNRPRTETLDNSSHVITNLLSEQGGHSEMSMEPKFPFPGKNKKETLF